MADPRLTVTVVPDVVQMREAFADLNRHLRWRRRRHLVTAFTFGALAARLVEVFL